MWWRVSAACGAGEGGPVYTAGPDLFPSPLFPFTAGTVGGALTALVGLASHSAVQMQCTEDWRDGAGCTGITFIHIYLLHLYLLRYSYLFITAVVPPFFCICSLSC